MTQEREAFEAWYAARTQGDNRPWVGTRGEMFAAWQARASLAQTATMLNGLTDAETNEAASVKGLIGDPGTSVNDGALVFARVMEYQGKTRREVRSPNLTARECIALANYIAVSDRAHYSQGNPQGEETVGRIMRSAQTLALAVHFKQPKEALDQARENLRAVALDAMASAQSPAASAPQPEAQQERDREKFMAGYAAAQADAMRCDLPPVGWVCTRKAGHDGPCAAVQDVGAAECVERGMARLREAAPSAQAEPYRCPAKRGEDPQVCGRVRCQLGRKCADEAQAEQGGK